MTDQLDELRAAAAKATQGPWGYSPWHIEEGPSAVVKKENGDNWYIANTSSDDDAAYIAAANPEVIISLLDDNARLRDAVKPFADHPDVPSAPDDARPYDCKITFGHLRNARRALTKGDLGMTDSAKTPISDLVKDAISRMESGARMMLDSIPNDSSLSSSSHAKDVTAEIARLAKRGLDTTPRPLSEIKGNALVVPQGKCSFLAGQTETGRWVDLDGYEVLTGDELAIPLSALERAKP